jgi:5-methylcytosine-specific restriction endonuclease McrA
MNHKKLNAALLWKHFEDVLVPTLRLSVTDRAVYSHLLRHTLLEGKSRFRCSMASLARGTRLCTGAVRPAIRRLASRGALRIIERNKGGHLVEVHPLHKLSSLHRRTGSPRPRGLQSVINLEQADFLQTRGLRASIHLRERGLCFYCLRRLSPSLRSLDHVVPLARTGKNSYRNLVSSCLECNSRKGELSAKDFLRKLFREDRLSSTEFTARLRALRALAAGKLRPSLPTSSARFSSARRTRATP